MIGKSLLAATLASGLVVPPEAGLYVPPKPAIVKPENLDLSSHLLAMPLTVGAIKPQSGPPATLSYVSLYRNLFLSLSRWSASDVPLGARAANRTVIFVICAIASTNISHTVQSVRLSFGFDGTINMTKRYELAVGNFVIAIFTVPQATWSRADVEVIHSTTIPANSWAIYAAYGLQSAVPTDTSASWGANALPASGLAVQRGGFVLGSAMTNRSDGVVSWSGLNLAESASSGGQMRSSTANLLATQAQSDLAASANFSVAGTFSAAAYASFR